MKSVKTNKDTVIEFESSPERVRQIRKICNCGFQIQKLVDAWTLKGRMGEHSTARFTEDKGAKK